MESILKSIKKKKIPINPAVVISNKANAKGLKIAKKLGINTEIIESKNFKGSRVQYDKTVIAALTKHGVTPRNGLVCLAGFMRIISPQFVKKYKNRIINIHPALLPAFPGALAYAQAYERGTKIVGVTAHYVTENLDQGPIIFQDSFKVDPNDSLEKIKAKGQKLEADTLLKAMKMHLENKLEVRWRKVHIKSK